MIICVMIALQAKSASSMDSEESTTHLHQPADVVLRVRNKVKAEVLKKQLRHLVRQDYEVCARIEGSRSFANFVVESNVESNPDCAKLTSINATLIQDMGFTSIKKWIEEYKSAREVMVQTLRDWSVGCDGFLSAEDRFMQSLRIADTHLNSGVNREIFSHHDPGAHQDLMSHWENFKKKLEDTHRLVEDQILSIDSCTKIVYSMVQDVSAFRPRSDFAKFLEKEALKTNLKGYRRRVNSIKQEIYRVLQLLPKHLNTESHFRRHPLVVLEERWAKYTLSTHSTYWDKNLDDVLEQECALITWIERLDGCVTFFKQSNVEEYDRFCPKLNEEDAKWYKGWGRHLNRLATEFTDFQESLMQRIEAYIRKNSSEWPDIQDRCSGFENDDDSVLPPTLVGSDANDLCSNLEDFIDRLKYIDSLEKNVRDEREIAHRNFYAVVCAHTAIPNSDRFFDIQKGARLLSDYYRCVDVNYRSQTIASFLDSFSDLFKTRNVMVASTRRRINKL